VVVPNVPLGSRLTVVLHEHADGRLIAERITIRPGEGMLA
jgi:hypothetical protein